ncbi:unnamed protein product [Trifolium pratense]|uniref:Uncharacterized protein n=1 Tax=Trifolium pratense TaxID=57577 RepID=A0ACB0K971_TRIPR|nr:unnamed protein product [Trifolium pratense]
MIALGISESVRYLVHQLGWDNFIFSDLSTFRNLTLEFLSSFKYEPNRGTYLHGGLVTFRMLGHTYHLTTHEIAEILGVPSGLNAFTKVQDDSFMDSELDYYWGSISGNPNTALSARYNTEIHNPAIRYFHKIIAHTFFRKPTNIQTVTKEELFLMFCVSQNRPVNAAVFLLNNIAKIIKEPTSRISIGGFVTFFARALGLHAQLSCVTPSASIQPMDIIFCFNQHLIGYLGPVEYLLLINFESVHQFTLPNTEKTSVHNKQAFWWSSMHHGKYRLT